MGETPRAGAQRVEKANARRAPFASKASLHASQGPAVLPVWLPVAEEFMFVTRPYLPALARAGGPIPKPITAIISQLTQVGIPQTKQNAGAEAYLEMAVALTKAVAVVPPPEAVAVADEVMEIMDGAELMEPLVTRSQFPDTLSYQLALSEARAVDARSIEAARVEAANHLALALVGVRAADQRPLFAEPLDLLDDQMCLVLDDEELFGVEIDPDRVCHLHRGDLVELVQEVFANAPGAMARFRAKP